MAEGWASLLFNSRVMGGTNMRQQQNDGRSTITAKVSVRAFSEAPILVPAPWLTTIEYGRWRECGELGSSHNPRNC